MIYGMDPWLIVGAGAVIAFLAYMKLFGGAKNKKLGFAIGAIAIAAGLFLPGGLYPLTMPTVAPSTGQLAGGPSGWTIEGVDTTATGWPDTTGVWNAEDTVCTFVYNINEETAHWAFAENASIMNFTVAPVAGPGATNDDVYTIHFRTDYSQAYSGAEILKEDGNKFFANWTTLSTATTPVRYGYTGSYSFIATDDPIPIFCSYYMSTDATSDGFCSKIATPGLTTQWNVYFWDDYGHTYTYTYNLVVITADSA